MQINEDLTDLEWSLRPMGTDGYGVPFGVRHAYEDVFTAALLFPGSVVKFARFRKGKQISRDYTSRSAAINRHTTDEEQMKQRQSNG